MTTHSFEYLADVCSPGFHEDSKPTHLENLVEIGNVKMHLGIAREFGSATSFALVVLRLFS